jgi:hypothetical protein
LEPIYSNSSGSYSYDCEKKIVHSIFHGTVIIEENMKILKSVLNFTEQKEIFGLLVDSRKLAGSFSMINDYLIHVYYKTLVSRGLRYNAIIVPYDIFSYFSTENLVEQLDNLELKTFSHVYQGQVWIESKVSLFCH